MKVGETTARHPDGLYFVVGAVGGTVVADVVGIEVCGSWQNFETKRHTYSDRSIRLHLSCPWLLSTRTVNRQVRPIWQWAGFPNDPTVGVATTLELPVRWSTVLFALTPDDYAKVKASVVPYANEFFCRHSSMGSWDAQRFKTFLRSLTWSDRFKRGFYNK